MALSLPQSVSEMASSSAIWRSLRNGGAQERSASPHSNSAFSKTSAPFSTATSTTPTALGGGATDYRKGAPVLPWAMAAS